MASWDDVVTYDDLQQMAPEQRQENFRRSVVLDLDTLSPGERDLLATMRDRLDVRAAAREERLRGQAS